MGQSVTLYDQIFAYIDNGLLSENQEIDFGLQGDDQDVLTIVKGFAGITPAPKKVQCTLKNVVPPTGFEFDAFEAFLTSTRHELKLQSAATGKALTSQGFFRNPKITSGVGKTVAYDFEFHGGPGSWG